MTGAEESSPRGRITLMRAVQDGRMPKQNLLAESSFCLGCRACEPVCPAGVEYGILLEEMREMVWQGKNRPLLVRGLLALVKTQWRVRLIGLFSPTGRKRKVNDDLHLMLGCFERRLFPKVSRTLSQIAPEVSIIKKQGCCGALHAHNGELKTGTEMAEKLGQDLNGTILTTAGGCAAHLTSVLGRARVREFSEWWASKSMELQPIEKDGVSLRVGFQDSCHLRNGLGIFEEPRTILKQISDYHEIPNASGCCGAAGSYSILQKTNSRKVLAPKIDAIRDLNLDYIATVNPGCTRQLAKELKRARIKTKVVHISELVSRAIS